MGKSTCFPTCASRSPRQHLLSASHRHCLAVLLERGLVLLCICLQVFSYIQWLFEPCSSSILFLYLLFIFLCLFCLFLSFGEFFYILGICQFCLLQITLATCGLCSHFAYRVSCAEVLFLITNLPIFPLWFMSFVSYLINLS